MMVSDAAPPLLSPHNTWENWALAMCCSLVVSLASLVVLSLLPLYYYFVRGRGTTGKPATLPAGVIEGLAAGATGAMFADLLLHQLPHVFGGHGEHQQLQAAIGVFGSLLLFFLVECAICGAAPHPHHDHTIAGSDKASAHARVPLSAPGACSAAEPRSVAAAATAAAAPPSDGRALSNQVQSMGLRQRQVAKARAEAEQQQQLLAGQTGSGMAPATAAATHHTQQQQQQGQEQGQDAAVVVSRSMGWLNLVADGVHNFTDGMAIGSGFMQGGWAMGSARTWFMLVHELPQELGDYSLLLGSGFTPVAALGLNFLSALASLAGTALALLLQGGGTNGIQGGGTNGSSATSAAASSLVDGITAGGFLYLGVSVLNELGHGAGAAHARSSSPGMRRAALLAVYTAAGFGLAAAMHQALHSHGGGCATGGGVHGHGGGGAAAGGGHGHVGLHGEGTHGHHHHHHHEA